MPVVVLYENKFGITAKQIGIGVRFQNIVFFPWIDITKRVKHLKRMSLKLYRYYLPMEVEDYAPTCLSRACQIVCIVACLDTI